MIVIMGHGIEIYEILLGIAIIAVPFLGAAVIAIARLSGKTGSVSAVFGLGATTGCVGLVAWFWTAVARPVSWQISWIDTAGIAIGLYIDDLSLLFAVLVAGVSLLSLVYSLSYMPHELTKKQGMGSSLALYYGYMLLFTGSMLGMVFASDLIQLYVFWELTGVASFLLIGLHWRDPQARYGAVKALLITAIGGLAALVGFILLGTTAGTFSLPGVLDSGDVLAASSTFGLALVLLLIGAATKSAQFPFHVWLPNAMVAPTPVSAFLHSAALVAAGVYLLARFYPIFASTLLWQLLVTGVGLTSMVIGGILALKARELKSLLAYSTISQYGFILVLLGYASSGALAAALYSFFQHGLIKAGLFFAAGIVTYATGRTELGNGGALASRLPATLVVSAVLALSLGGLPPLAGFWMKEGFLGATLDMESLGLVLLGLGTAAITLTYMLRFLGGAFVGDQAVRSEVAFPPVIMLVAPGALALLTLVFGLKPDLAALFVEPAATAVLGQAASLDLSLHADLKLLLSLLALALGAVAFATYRRWGFLVDAVTRPEWSLDRLYAGASSSLRRAGQAALRLQNGLLPSYIHLALLGLLGLVVFSVPPVFPALSTMTFVGGAIPSDRGLLDWGMALLLLLIIAGTATTFVVRSHLHVILALSVVGYLIAGVFALELAPNVGLVQVHVETLVTVLFVLALVLIPRPIRQRLVLDARKRLSLWTLALAALGGLGSTWISWLAIEHVPEDPIAPWFNENALGLTHAGDVVAAILVDFRALDTLGEITVFGVAMLGVYAIVRLVRKEME